MEHDVVLFAKAFGFDGSLQAIKLGQINVAVQPLGPSFNLALADCSLTEKFIEIAKRLDRLPVFPEV
uniref:Uncharacterized protein n=1 Tax=Acrobeloides nanus TaxID=290746 RepID=A0A914CUY5_9BILA